ncbi:MAG: hypothetical protein JXR95_13085, partial [Deltaproteobacteria bacterium]|nr:hypothetical protein [Deltaproteobacteria bacterium]
DGDSYIDCDDQDCFSHQICNTVPSEICDNGEDDDGDSYADCDDPDCVNEIICSPEICDDAQDNNGNSGIDCLDEGCFGESYCGECDPFTGIPCDSGVCYVDKTDGFVARCYETAGNVRLNDYCSSPDSCEMGLYCSDSGYSSTCFQLCYPGIIEECPDGTQCTAFTDWSYITNTSWGLCWPQ